MKTVELSLRLTALALLLALAGCASVAKEQFYALFSPAQASQIVSADFDKDVTIHVADIPELIDRPQLVIFSNASALTVLDHERWAESLQSGITRVISKDVAKAIPRAWVTSTPDGRASTPLRVVVHVEEMTGSSQGKVVLTASWVVKSGADKALASGRLTLEREANLPLQTGELVELWSDELNSLSQAIALSVVNI
ncbi:putative lipoprotein YmbA [Oxalobacteraceae bacterium GrIS 2.11]